MDFSYGPPRYTHDYFWNRFQYRGANVLQILPPEHCPQPVIVRRNAHKEMLVTGHSNRVDEIRMIENYSPVDPPRATNMSALQPAVSPSAPREFAVRIVVDMNTCRGVEGKTDNSASLTRPQVMDRLVRMVARNKFITRCGSFELSPLMGISVVLFIDPFSIPGLSRPILENEILAALGWNDLPEGSSLRSDYHGNLREDAANSEHWIVKSSGAQDSMYLCIWYDNPVLWPELSPALFRHRVYGRAGFR